MRGFVNGSGGGPAFLTSRQPCFVGELFTVSLLSGTVYRWTSYTQSLTVGAETWLTAIDGAPLVTRNRFGAKNTVEIPELELRLGASDALLSNLKAQIHNGLFDGARVEMDRVFMPVPGNTAFGYVLLFNGRQSGAVIDAEGITLTAKGDNVLMNQQAPRNLYQTNCLHAFCDAGCTLLQADYSFTGRTVGAGSNAGNIAYTLPSGFTAANFINGKVTMTSGAAIGQVRTVRFASSISLALTYPLYNAPSPGNTFTLMMGCGKQQTDCQTRKQANATPVDNIQHYRGFPYVPQAEIGV